MENSKPCGQKLDDDCCFSTDHEGHKIGSCLSPGTDNKRLKCEFEDGKCEECDTERMVCWDLVWQDHRPGCCDDTKYHLDCTQTDPWTSYCLSTCSWVYGQDQTKCEADPKCKWEPDGAQVGDYYWPCISKTTDEP